MNLPSITQMPVAQLHGKKVLLRLDLDLPLKDHQPSNLLRLERGLSVLKFLQTAGAVVLILAHLGRDGSTSLEPVIKVLQQSLPVEFIPDFRTALQHLAEVVPGTIIATENIRREPGELNNSSEWAKEVAAAADLYVNEAFAVCHRDHASITQLPKFLPRFAGPALLEEVHHLEQVLKPKLPLGFIIGGAKFKTKLGVLNTFSTTADQILVGGALAHVFLHHRGFTVGRSLLDSSIVLPASVLESPKIVLPTDVVVRAEDDEVVAKMISEITPTDTVVDVGPATLEAWGTIIAKSATILWNGPLGYFEEGFAAGTKKLAELITTSSAFSVVGGGDTIAAINSPALLAKFGFVSAAGGAMLQFLSEGTLPGLEALK